MFEYLRKLFSAKTAGNKSSAPETRNAGPATFGKKPKVVVRQASKPKRAKTKRR